MKADISTQGRRNGRHCRRARRGFYHVALHAPAISTIWLEASSEREAITKAIALWPRSSSLFTDPKHPDGYAPTPADFTIINCERF